MPFPKRGIHRSPLCFLKTKVGILMSCQAGKEYDAEMTGGKASEPPDKIASEPPCKTVGAPTDQVARHRLW